MSDLLEPGSPADFEDPPRPRRRTALVVVAIVCVIAAGIAVGLVIGTGDDADDVPDVQIAESPVVAPSVSLPPGCELLTPGQVAALVPGEPTKVGRGPEVVVDATESACEWFTTRSDPNDSRVRPAALAVKATAAPDEETARSTLRISLPCQGADSEQTTVSGADEACLNHKASDGQDGRADTATVSARFQTLVVEVSYLRPSWPAWRVDDQTTVTAGALIGRVVQSP
ncbi:hypothetical protein [Actinophytocola sp.]|uniref:hypothetical protein n=1 Tax=Actinophytocola sp. TaxID=1872138 RepID=UPI003D6B6AFF